MEHFTKDLAKKLGERIRVLRSDKGLSQEVLGERSGLHPNYIGAVERGEKNLTLDSLMKIARSLDTQLGQLFHSVDPLAEKTQLGQIVSLLSERNEADHALVLTLIQSVFAWENEKRK